MGEDTGNGTITTATDTEFGLYMLSSDISLLACAIFVH